MIMVGFVFSACSTNTTTHKDENPLIETDNMQYKEIYVEGYNFRFESNEIVLKKGETVRIIFESKEGFHDLVSNELGIATKQLNAAQSDSIIFTPQEIGDFEFYCSIGNHRELGMVGTIRVIE